MNAPAKIEAASSVYAKIAAVQGALAKHGIGKDRTNATPGANYSFRGIDDVYNALAPLLASHGLCILPRIVGHSLTERGKTQRGNPIFAAVVDAEFDFVSADDGSKHTIRTFGEAMDSSDKATNKAMSAAYKYAALMAFAIPTEGDNDADATTLEIAPEAARGQSKGSAVSPSPLISDSDWAFAVQLMDATGTDAGKVCKAHNIGSLKELTADQWKALKPILEKRLEAAAQKEKANV